MPRYAGPQKVEIWWVPTIANIAAPTTAELNAGTDMTPFMIDAEFPNPGNTIDAADGSSLFDKVVPGTTGGQKAVLHFHRDSVKASDTAFTTLAPGTVGNFAVASRPLATYGTFAVADDVDIYACTVISRDQTNLLARNATVQFTVEAAITDTPTIDFPLAV